MHKDDKTIPQDSQVVPSPAMVPPALRDMIARRTYPVKRVPPAAHARTWYDMETATAGMTYNGVDILRFAFAEETRPRLRYHSDGNFLSRPFTQQCAISADGETRARVDFFAPVELWNMRPRRAQAGEAILGQMGRPLLYGVNGLYLPDWDLLVSWHGQPFAWRDSAVRQDADGFHAALDVTLTERPWLILIRPRYYGEHLSFAEYQPWDFRPNPRPVTGWCSWEAYHSDVTQENIRQAAQALQPLRPFGLSVMQLDDGFQQTQVPLYDGADVGESWLNLNDKFPDGHAGVVGAMQGGGFEAGVWTNATLTNREAAESIHCCLTDESGELIKGDWIQYVLDCKPETLARHTTPYYRAFREAGYTYFKSDSLRHLLYDGMQEAVRLGLMDDETARQRQRAYMEAARQGIGPDAYYLSCWGVLTPSIGVCDAMRVATDSNPSWGAFSMQLRETARWFFAQRVLFTLDPDVVCVRGPLPWARMLLSLVSLTGGLMMISDDPTLYDEARLDLIRRTMPGLATHAAETGPVDYTTPACCSTRGREDLDAASVDIAHAEDARTPFASLWCTHFEQAGRCWSVMQRTAVVPLEAIDLPLEALSLDPSRAYLAFDFWQQSPVPVEGGVLRLPALALGDTTVLAVVAQDGGLPVLLGSDRHVSMDAVSVGGFEATAQAATLSLHGFAGLTANYTLYAPSLEGTLQAAEGCAASVTKKDAYLTVSVAYQAERARVTIA